MTALTEQLFAALSARGDGDKDHTALMTVIEGLANHQVGLKESNDGS